MIRNVDIVTNTPDLLFAQSHLLIFVLEQVCHFKDFYRNGSVYALKMRYCGFVD